MIKVSQLKGLIKKTVFRNIVGVAGGNILNNLSSFIIIIFAARSLAPPEFAKLTLVLSISNNLATILDFESQITFVRFYSLATLETERESLIQSILKWKILLLILTSLLALPIAQLITNSFSILRGSFWLTSLSIIAGGLFCIWMTIRGIEQAQKDFRSFSIYTIAYGFLRLAFAAFFISTRQVSALNIFISLSIAPLFVLIFYNLCVRSSWSLNKHTKKHRSTWLNELKTLKSLLQYCLWAGPSAILFTITYQIPQYMLAARSASSHEIALYGAALTFIPVFMLTNEAVRTVLVPDITAIQDVKGRKEFRRQLWKLAPIYFGVMAICLMLIAVLQYILLGNTYRASVPVFLVLGASVVIIIYLGLANILIHAVGNPSLMAIGNAVRAALIFCFCFLLPTSALLMSAVFGIIMIAVEFSIYLILKQQDSASSGFSL